MDFSLKSFRWEERHGFSSPNEYAQFLRYLTQEIAASQVEEVEVDEDYGQGEIYGGRWFKDIQSGEVWRLVPPDIPFKGLWEPVCQNWKNSRSKPD